MTNPISMGRRSFVRSLPAAAAIAALPAAAAGAVASPEHPNDKVRRLAAEIRETLNDPAFIGFRQITITPTWVMSHDAEQDLSAGERVGLNFARLADAMNELTADGHGWQLIAAERNSGSGLGGYDGRRFSAWGLQLELGTARQIERAIDIPEIAHLEKAIASRRAVPAIHSARGA